MPQSLRTSRTFRRISRLTNPRVPFDRADSLSRDFSSLSTWAAAVTLVAASFGALLAFATSFNTHHAAKPSVLKESFASFVMPKASLLRCEIQTTSEKADAPRFSEG